jgi:hypothetical protein
MGTSLVEIKKNYEAFNKQSTAFKDMLTNPSFFFWKTPIPDNDVL